MTTLQEPRGSGRLRTPEPRRSPADVHADFFKPHGSRVSELEEGVRALLETQLDSFEKLEIMQALCTAGRAMSRQQIAAACQLGSEVVEEAVADLERTRWITRGRGGRVRPGNGCTDPSFTVLMELYADDRARILVALSSIALQRIRNMAATAFADAFANKKRDDDE